MTILGSLEFGARTGFPTTLSTTINLGFAADRWLVLFSTVVGAGSGVFHTGATIGGTAMTADGNFSMMALIGVAGQFASFRLDGGAVPTGVQTLNVTRNDASGWNQVGYVIWGDGQTNISAPTAFTVSSATAFAASRASATGQLVILAAHLQSEGAGPVVVTPTAPATGLTGTGSQAAVQRNFGMQTAGAATASLAATISGSQSTPSVVYQAWTLSGAAGDTTPPTLTGSITQGATTASSIGVTWPAGADNIAVTAYEVSSNGGASYVASNGATATTASHTFTGLAVGTAHAIRVRVKDAAGNVSTPALAASFSTGAASDTTPPTLTGSITQGATTSASLVVTWPAGADNVAVTGYEVSSNGGTSYVASNGATATTTSHTFTGLAAGTAYAIRVRAKDAAGNVSTPALAASFSTGAAGTFGFTAGPCFFLTDSGPQLGKAVTWALIYGSIGAYAGAVTVDGAGTLDAGAGTLSVAGLALSGAADLYVKDADGGIYYQRVTSA